MVIFFHQSVAFSLVNKEMILWVSKFCIHFPSKPIKLINYFPFLIHKHRCVQLLHYPSTHHLIVNNVIHLRDVIKCGPIWLIICKFLSLMGKSPVPVPLQKNISPTQSNHSLWNAIPTKFTDHLKLCYIFWGEYRWLRSSSVQYPLSLTAAAKLFLSECKWSPIPLLFGQEVSLYHNVLDHGYSFKLVNKLFLHCCYHYILLPSIVLSYPVNSFCNGIWIAYCFWFRYIIITDRLDTSIIINSVFMLLVVFATFRALEFEAVLDPNINSEEEEELLLILDV